MIWRLLFFSQLREQPGRSFITVLAIALGVALGTAVYLVNSAALNDFGLATKRLVGESDVIVRGAREGFPEQLFAQLARNPKVAIASPVLELDVALAGRTRGGQVALAGGSGSGQGPPPGRRPGRDQRGPAPLYGYRAVGRGRPPPDRRQAGRRPREDIRKPGR